MSEKVIKPDTYELRHGYQSLEPHESLKAFVVYREKDNYKFFDVVVSINGRLFVVKPLSFYSKKTFNVYNCLLRKLALEQLGK